MATVSLLSLLEAQAGGGRKARKYDLPTSRASVDVLRGTTGIYILQFFRGDAYVGKAVNVLRRIGQHQQTISHGDFSSFCFVPTDELELDDVERGTIAACERAGIELAPMSNR